MPARYNPDQRYKLTWINKNGQTESTIVRGGSVETHALVIRKCGGTNVTAVKVR